MKSALELIAAISSGVQPTEFAKRRSGLFELERVLHHGHPSRAYAILVLAPFGGAILCAVLGASRTIRSSIVLATGAVLIASALWLMPLVPISTAG